MALRKKKQSPELTKLEATKILLVKVEDGGDSGYPDDLFFVAYENAPETLAHFDDGEVIAIFTFEKFAKVKRQTTLEPPELA